MSPKPQPPAYAELHAVSNFSFLRGASHPEELVVTAATLGHQALAITDHNTLSGVVRGHVAARDLALNYIVASRIDLADGPSRGYHIGVAPSLGKVPPRAKVMWNALSPEDGKVQALSCP